MSKRSQLALSRTLRPVLVVLAVLGPGVAHAYVGPGGGVSLLGSTLALLVGIVAAIFGFVWYPFKRLFRKLRGSRRAKVDDDKAGVP